jgi:hypothetical protein
MQPLEQRALLAIAKAKRCFVIVTVIVDVAKVTVLTAQPNAEACDNFQRNFQTLNKRGSSAARWCHVFFCHVFDIVFDSGVHLRSASQT